MRNIIERQARGAGEGDRIARCVSRGDRILRFSGASRRRRTVVAEKRRGSFALRDRESEAAFLFLRVALAKRGI